MILRILNQLLLMVILEKLIELTYEIFIENLSNKIKLELINKNNDDTTSLKVGAIYWVDLGYNIGSELRKLRPAILWRSASNKKMWTAIPLTSKHKDDNYYFHYDLIDEKSGPARLENLINISSNIIREPYYINNKIATITKKDNDDILKIINKYLLLKK